MTVEHRPTSTGEPPDPYGAATIDELVIQLRLLRAWAGQSYRAVHRDIARLRAARQIPEQPVYNTVYRCFQVGRSRLDVELVVDIAQVLLGDQVAAGQWRQACQLIAAHASIADVADAAVLARVAAVTDRLPDDTAGFAGRGTELQQLVAISPGTPTIAVVDGMAGVGKTRLVFHAAHALVARGHFATIQLVADLCGFDPERSPADPAAVLDGFLRCLGVSGDLFQHLDLAGRTDLYRSRLRGTSALIVLDNAATVEQVAPLLPDGSTCRTLVTSRRALRISGARRVSLGVFSAAESMALLRSIVGADRIDTAPAAAARIAELLGQLPLALALVAARMQANPQWTIADQLERIERRRDGSQLDDGVELALSLSYQDLQPDIRRTLLLLAAHPGEEFDVAAASALAGTELPAGRQQLEYLLSCHLLQRISTDRYGFHDLIRLYATGRSHEELPASARRAAVIRLLEHYQHSAALAMRQYAPQRQQVGDPGAASADPTSAAKWLHGERANLIASAIAADANGVSTYAATQSQLLWSFLFEAGYYRDIEILHRLAMRTATGTERTRELSQFAAVLCESGRLDAAVDQFSQALELARSNADLAGARRALTGLGNCCWRLERCEEALAHQQQALAIARELDDRSAAGRTLGNIAAVYERLGRYPEALEYFTQNLAIARELDNHAGQSSALGNMGAVCQRLGRYDEAYENSLQALTLARQIGSRTTESMWLGNLAESLAGLGRHEEAIATYLEALTLSRELGRPSTECFQLNGLAEIYRRQGRYEEALQLHRQALPIAQRTGDRLVQIQTHNSIGETLGYAGSPTQSLEHHRQALDAATEFGDRYEQARAHDGIARIHATGDDREMAADHWRHALQLYTELGVPRADDVRKALVHQG